VKLENPTSKISPNLACMDSSSEAERKQRSLIVEVMEV